MATTRRKSGNKDLIAHVRKGGICGQAVDDPFNTILQQIFPEIDQNTETEVHQTQIGQELF
jgi:hypothetical protein